MKKISFEKLLIVCLLTFVINAILKDIVFMLSSILLLILLAHFFVQNRINIFNPINLFTLYYFSAIPAFLYLHYNKFAYSPYIGHGETKTNLDSLLLMCLLYFIFGYICALLGYKSFEKKGLPIFNFDDGVSLKIVNIFIWVFSCIGILNFLYVLVESAGGNILLYLMNVSVRKYELQEMGLSTLGYQFGYVAAYLWFYKVLKSKKMSYLFFLYLVVIIFIKATTGRISSTLFFALTFFGVYYTFNLKNAINNNIKYFMLFLSAAFLGVFFFFFRIVSSMNFNNMLDEGWLLSILSFMKFDTIMYLAVDKGNVPNIAIFIKILDSWGSDIGFLYGKSFLYCLYSFIPSFIRPQDYQISVVLQKVWYPNAEGSLPPTGLGEMYANFGILGPFLGMYFFGSVAALTYNLLFRYNNYWYVVVYSNISIYFIMLYAKGEFDNLSLWNILPILITYWLLVKLSKLTSANNQTAQLKCINN